MLMSTLSSVGYYLIQHKFDCSLNGISLDKTIGCFYIYSWFCQRKQYKLLLVQVYLCMKNTNVVWKCNMSRIFIYCVLLLTKHSLHGQDYRVVQFISTYVIGVYCHRNCEFDTFPWSGVLNTTYFSGCPVS
jgi:hypothetical protein